MSEPTPQTSDSTAPGRAERFLVNVIWSWMGVAANFMTGFFLSPYIIRKLGDERYGIWALAFAFIDYFVLFDFGFRQAAVTLISRFRAKQEDVGINEVINTSLFYFIALASAILLGTVALAGSLHNFFQIAPEHRDSFAALVRIIGLGWTTSIALSVTIAGLEAFHEFKAQSKIYVLALIIRSGGCALVLYLGYGLTAMGVTVTLAQFFTYTLSFICLKRAFPGMKISPALARWSMWKKMSNYGVHSFTGSLGTMLLNQGPVMLIGHLRTSEFVGYFSMPARLLNYMVELVTRIGFITLPNTSELEQKGQRKEIIQMGTYLNRYCLALFVPLGVFLLVYGRELISVWITPAFAERVAPLLLPFVLCTTLAIAGQYNSVAILFGLAKHATYSRLLILEGVLVLAGILLVLPSYGLLGAAWVSATLSILNRGLVTSYLLCEALEYPLAKFLWSIYSKPLLLTVPTFGLAFGIKYWLPGDGWVQILAVLGMISTGAYLLFFFMVLEKEHRALVRLWLYNRTNKLTS